LAPPRALPPSDTAAGGLARASLLGVAYFVAAASATHLAIDFAYSIPVWPASGVALAGMLLLPHRFAVPAVFLGSLFACTSASLSPSITLAVSVGAVLASWSAAVVLRRVPRFSPALATARDVVAFAIVGAVLAPALGAALGVAAVIAGGRAPVDQVLTLTVGWWAGAGIGVLLIAPAILAFARPLAVPAPAGTKAECLALAACVALAGLIPSATGLARHVSLVFFAAALVPPLLWAAIRHDRRALVLTNLGLAALSSVLLFGMRPSVGEAHVLEHAAVLQVLIGVVATMSLVVSAALGEWRSAEAHRRASGERFRAAIDGGFDAFGILRAVRAPDGRLVDFEIVELNERARHFLQFVHPSPDGQRVTEVLPAIRNGQFFPRVTDCFERGVAREDEYRTAGAVLPTDFPIECLRALIVPLSDGVAVTIRDISEAKRLEAQLAQAVKLEAVGRLAGGVAHDFNNLLTAISGYGEVALSQLPAEAPVREDVQEMLRASERAAALTRQLLAFSRRQALRREALDVNAIVRDTTGLLGRVLGADVRLVTKLEPALPPVLADTGQIEQLVMNLALNARDALPAGGEIMLSTRADELDQSGARRFVGAKPGRYVRVEVCDDGVGMDEPTRARVFEPFFTTKPPGKGTGLGLAIVYGIVQQNDGHILVESAPGRGTRFEILFPVHEGVPGVVETTAPSPGDVASPGRTILLAEDEEPLRKLIERVLGAAGYRVCVGRDGAEAQAIAEALGDEIDLLVTDVVMPQLGGRALAAQLRARRPGLPVLFVSGFDADGVRAAGTDSAPSDFLPKPFAAQALLDCVRELLEHPEVPRA